MSQERQERPEKRNLFSFRRKETPPPEQLVFDNALDLYRAWNLKEVGAIIDFDLTAGPSSFERRFAKLTNPKRLTKQDLLLIAAQLKELDDELKATTPKNHENQHLLDFARERVEASYYYVRRRRGDRIDPVEYLEKTTGEEIIPISDKELSDMGSSLRIMAATAGIPVSSPEAMNEWKLQNSLDEQTAKFLLQHAAGDFLNRIGRTDEVNLQYTIQTIYSPEYFWAWAKTDPRNQEFVLLMNFNTGTKIWTPGKTDELALHEVGEHLRRMSKLRELIRDGKLHPFFGATVVHGPESTIEEGLALTIAHLVPGAFEALTDEGKFRVNESILRHMVYANVHINLHSPQKPTRDDIVNTIHEFIPWEPEDEIDRQIDWRTQNPELQAYLLTYGLGAKRFMRYAKDLNSRGKETLLSELSKTPFTPKQLDKKVEEIENDRKNVHHSPSHEFGDSNRRYFAGTSGK